MSSKGSEKPRRLNLNYDLCFGPSYSNVLTRLVQGGAGSRLVLERVGREAAGGYQCVASNGVEEAGETVAATINLTVHC